MMNGIKEIAESVSSELKHRLPKQRKTQRTKLALLVSTMLEVRSANLMDFAAALPRDADGTDMRYQWIIRLLGNPLVISDAVMEPFAREVLERAAAELDPGPIQDVGPPPGADARGALGRAGPAAGLAGRGDRGRDRVRHPAGAARGGRPLAAGTGRGPAAGRPLLWHRRPDRLVPAARHRLRLKGNLAVVDATGRTTTGQCARDRVYYLEDVELTGRRARTPIGIIHDPGHAEPWIIAMSEKPGYLRTLEYSARWGIEPMFADFKSRGFGIEDTQLRYADRLDRLILVMALALYVAVSTGQWDAVHHPTPSEKKLGRQSLLLEGALFEGGEVGCRIPAEAGAQDPGVVALFQATSGFAPFDKIDRRQVRGRDRGKAGQRGGEDAYGTAHNQARRRDLASGGAPLMVALGTEELLQVVVGRRQAGDPQPVEQAGAVAPGHLEEVVDRAGQGAGRVAALPPRLEQAVEALLDLFGIPPGRVLQDAGAGVDPAKAPPNVRPQRPGALQALGKQGPQFLQLGWQAPPFCSTRPRLASMASRRSCSRSPAASSGGRPSSVRALRTAAQYPCTICAASSVRPSTVRSVGRTPRTVFFNSFLACRSAS